MEGTEDPQSTCSSKSVDCFLLVYHYENLLKITTQELVRKLNTEHIFVLYPVVSVMSKSLSFTLGWLTGKAVLISYPFFRNFNSQAAKYSLAQTSFFNLVIFKEPYTEVNLLMIILLKYNGPLIESR